MVDRATTLPSGPNRYEVCLGRALHKDRISELPNDIVVHILSTLKMKEAGRTSVLSKRWRYVWAYIPVLDFDASGTMTELMLKTKFLEVEKPRYLQWVNQVIRSYKGQTIEEFTVRFDIDKTSNVDIDNWLKFAMEKRVKRFELNFPYKLRTSQASFYSIDNLPFSNSLTSLHLVSLNVTGEVIETFLKNCPQLEFLKVQWLFSRLKLRVASFKLKYLEIIKCFPIEYIEISAPNLVSFKYVGPKISMPFRNTPKLAEMEVGGHYGAHLAKNFTEISSHLSQLEMLALDVSVIHEFNMKYIVGFPQCKMLKQLEVTLDPGDGDLFGLTSIVKACPFLHKFVLKLDWEKPDFKREELKVEACGHDHLKIFEIVGFVGHAIDLEFIMYLVECCVALEKIIIDLRSPLLVGTPWEFDDEDMKMSRARKQAKKLCEKLQKLKPAADLIII